MGKIIPIVLALIGLGAGVGGGVLLRPDPENVSLENPCGDPVDHENSNQKKEKGEDTETYDYVKLNNQFVIPVVSSEKITSLVVISLSLEVTLGQSEAVYHIEPKIRDVFLQVLFDHANTGGFSGDFTNSGRMDSLRLALRETAQHLMGDVVSDVLITDVVRQDA
jgi:hypothetical protein